MEKVVSSAVMELAQRGMKKLAQQRQEQEEAEFIKTNMIRDAWQKLQGEVRQGFPEVIRKYVFLPDMNDETPGDFPNESKARILFIRIEGFAPIRVFAVLTEAGWKQEHEPSNGGYYRLPLFEIPRADWDYDYGVFYSWKWNTTHVEELDEALARALEESEKYDVIKEQHKPKPIEEGPVYEAMEGEEKNPFVDELVRLVRDVVKEQLEQGAA